MNADGNDAERIPADPPEWSALTNSQVSKFAESLGNVLDAGIFPRGLAEELSAYREAANKEMGIRLRHARERRTASDNELPFRPV